MAFYLHAIFEHQPANQKAVGLHYVVQFFCYCNINKCNIHITNITVMLWPSNIDSHCASVK